MEAEEALCDSKTFGSCRMRLKTPLFEDREVFQLPANSHPFHREQLFHIFSHEEIKQKEHKTKEIKAI